MNDAAPSPQRDYRDTVFLPQTGFPMRGDLPKKEPQILAIYDKLLAAIKKRNLFAGIHNGTASYAAKMIGKGFRFVTIANDSGLMAMAARGAVNQCRKEAGAVADK